MATQAGSEKPAGALVPMSTLVAVDGISEIPEFKEAPDEIKPYKLMSLGSDQMLEVQKCWNIAFKTRILRYLFFIGTFVLLLILLSSGTSTDDDDVLCEEWYESLNENSFGGSIGWLIIFVATVWLINFWVHAWVGCCCSKSDRYLFSVHTRWSQGIFAYLSSH